jgi:hypothetical protein
MKKVTREVQMPPIDSAKAARFNGKRGGYKRVS